MKTAQQIIEIWKSLKGGYKQRAHAITELLGWKLERLPRELYKVKEGDCGSDSIRTTALNDKYALFTFFHELAHSQLHYRQNGNNIFNFKYYCKNKDKIEEEANKYATEIMIALYGKKGEIISRVCCI